MPPLARRASIPTLSPPPQSRNELDSGVAASFPSETEYQSDESDMNDTGGQQRPPVTEDERTGFEEPDTVDAESSSDEDSVDDIDLPSQRPLPPRRSSTPGPESQPLPRTVLDRGADVSDPIDVDYEDDGYATSDSVVQRRQQDWGAESSAQAMDERRTEYHSSDGYHTVVITRGLSILDSDEESDEDDDGDEDFEERRFERRRTPTPAPYSPPQTHTGAHSSTDVITLDRRDILLVDGLPYGRIDADELGTPFDEMLDHRGPRTATRTLTSFLTNNITALLPTHPSYPAPGTTCSICHTPYSSAHGPVLISNVPQCRGHIIGYSCLRKWISSGADNSNKCPMCRTQWFSIRKFEIRQVMRQWQDVERAEEEAIRKDDEAFGEAGIVSAAVAGGRERSGGEGGHAFGNEMEHLFRVLTGVAREGVQGGRMGGEEPSESADHLDHEAEIEAQDEDESEEGQVPGPVIVSGG